MAASASATESAEGKFKCPNCKKLIPLTEAMAGPLLAQAEEKYNRQLGDQRTALETELNAKARKWAEEKSDAAIKLAQANAAQAYDDRIRMAAQLKVAQEAQALSVVKERDLESRERALTLEVERKVNSGLVTERGKIMEEISSEFKLQLATKEEERASLLRQIEDLKHRATMGNSFMVGEAQEVMLEQMLATTYPLDTITAVGKGEFGGDCIQIVGSTSGRVYGSILYESKRTKEWRPSWLAKLRDDQRAAKSDVSVLVTQTMPAGVKTFGLVDGVWVTSWECAPALVVILRHMLTEVSMSMLANEGAVTKTRQVYAYMTGPRFKQRVQAIVEQVGMMQEDLTKEEKAVTRMWAKRREQIQRTVEATAGLYGDLQGIAGKSLADVPGLALESGE